jgi:FKBP-type peptidyl-prolyl cis-trans isomerase FklB
MLLMGIASAQDAKPATPSKPAQSTSSQSKTPAAKKPASSTAKPATAAPLTTQKQKESYALGMSIGLGFQKQGIDKSVDSSLVVRGFRDSIAGSKTAMTEDEMKAALQQLRTEVMSAQEAKSKEAGAANRKEGESFLAENKSKDGVKTLPDGLQYKVLTEGNGPKPASTDTVTVNYRGTLINGKEFDSSYKRGQPASFPVTGVIKGWTEALQLMPVGSKWQLFIPPDLAYGDRGAGADIGPGDTLIFEVELLSIGDQKKQ